MKQLKNLRDSYVAHDLKVKKECELSDIDFEKIFEIAEKDIADFCKKLILEFPEWHHITAIIEANINVGGQVEALFDIIAGFEKSDRAKEIAENIKQENEKLRIKYNKKFTGKRMII